MRGLGAALADLWYLSRPYFTSDERKSAWGLLGVVLGLTLLLVGADVLQSFSRNIFYTALQQRDVTSFLRGLFWFVRTPTMPIPGFFIIAVPSLLAAVYATYLQQLLQLRWRRWLTHRMVSQWLDQNVAFRIAIEETGLTAVGDNPDQRIQEDIDGFVRNTLSQFLDIVSRLVTLFSYVGLLWVLSGAISIFGVRIPGYFLWIALLYSLFASAVTHLTGRRLIPLRIAQQKAEADFRYSLVHIRDHAASIALSDGANHEKRLLIGKFDVIYDNFLGIMKRAKWLGFLTDGLGTLSGNFALLVGSIRYFAGKITFGTLMQLVQAFSRVEDALGWIWSSYASLTEWRANVARLATFQRMMDRASIGTGKTTREIKPTVRDIVTDHLDIYRPDGSVLLSSVNITLPRGHDIVLIGPSGLGKSTLLRTLAGIWPFTSGTIRLPAEEMMFVPQSPYLPLGTLRATLCYPRSPETVSDDRLCTVLTQVGLSALIDDRDTEARWAERLSPGEQQRLMFGRVLLNQPEWVFLDESTSNLDAASENRLYDLLRDHIPSVTIVSVTHRITLQERHPVTIDLQVFAPSQ